jgi:hypothetical protein
VNEPGPVVLETRKAEHTGTVIPYQAYVFRVVRVEPAGPPESLDDVRDEVVANVKQIQAFELAGQKARALAEAAREVGLVRAVAEAEELKALLSDAEAPPATTQSVTSRPYTGRYVRMLRPFEPESFTRQAGFINNVGMAPNLTEKVFAPAEPHNPEAPDGHRVLVAPVANNRKWVVAEVLQLSPIYRGDFDLRREELKRDVAMGAWETCLGGWFDPENILRRANYVPAAPTSQPEPNAAE